MKYDKYGDPIVEADQKLSGKQVKAVVTMIILQGLLIAANVIAMLMPSGGVIVVFLTAFLFLFFFIAYLKGCSGIKETSKLPTYCKVTTIVSPILYVLTAILAVFS
ncbi:MAG: hypothetical protein IKU10_04855 [Clostridia bacterium]|nr:hypothetical protein [Clostridia bacterium]